MSDDAGLSRKQFLTGLLMTAAATAVPKGLQDPTAPTTQEITVEDIRSMEKVLAIELTEDERKQILNDLKGNRQGIERIRQEKITYQVEPPMPFRPLDPPLKGKTELRLGRQRTVPMPSSATDLAFLSARELGQLVRTKKVSPVELTRLYLERLEKYGEQLLAVVTLTPELAMQQARQAEAEIMRGQYRGPLHGLPYGIKDLFATKGIPTTWGAEPYKAQTFDYDAAVVERLNGAGAIMLAKLSMGALAMGDMWFKGRTLNPWNLQQGSSGSSAGSASATAAGLAAFTIGTETLGSIMSPSHQCRVTGLRPTYGRVSRHGAMAVSWTMDKVGPICRSVDDCALVFAAIAGYDPRDRSTVESAFQYRATLDLKSLKIGYLVGPNDDPKDLSKLEKDSVLKALVAKGAQPRPVFLGVPPPGILAILEVEAATAFDEFTRSDLIDQLKNSAWPTMYRSSRFISGVDYLQAQRARSLLMHDFTSRWGDFDVVVCPGTGGPVLTTTNLTGHPQVLVPLGSLAGGSTSVSVVARPYREDLALGVARAIQHSFDFHLRKPKGFE